LGPWRQNESFALTKLPVIRLKDVPLESAL
jgi:hypothetical protein